MILTPRQHLHTCVSSSVRQLTVLLLCSLRCSVSGMCLCVCIHRDVDWLWQVRQAIVGLAWQVGLQAAAVVDCVYQGCFAVLHLCCSFGCVYAGRLGQQDVAIKVVHHDEAAASQVASEVRGCLCLRVHSECAACNTTARRGVRIWISGQGLNQLFAVKPCLD